MHPCFQLQFTTPKKYVLNGLWFGPKRPKRVIVWVHGLSSSVFSMQHVVHLLANKETAVLVFNNRGHDVVSKLSSVKKGKRLLAGAAHELFTDCVDDIQGALKAARKISKNIYLAGHSTGCQKSIYWASKDGRGVKGIILLAPVSDYAAAVERIKDGGLTRGVAAARKLVRAGKQHDMLPQHLQTGLSIDDAQRFLSLYTPDSSETIFIYDQPSRTPRALKSVRKPILVLWAGQDEYSDRSAKEATDWFKKHLKQTDKVVIVPRVPHNFKGAEKTVVREIRRFIA